MALTWCFNFRYGPVEVALPLHVTMDLDAPGGLLGLYWTLFGVGAVLGGLAVGALRRLPLWPVTVGIVIAWGIALLPFGLDAPTAVTVACFALGGAIYGPFVALSVTLMQATAPPQHLAVMLAARSVVLLTAAPLGTALGGTDHPGGWPTRDACRLRSRHGRARGVGRGPAAGTTDAADRSRIEKPRCGAPISVATTVTEPP